ncbi:UNVERIFIED_CONTAM: hypothetical protein NCL1_62279 [Trichonephila clavipes]
MPFGLSISSNYFEKYINYVFRELLRDDDIIIPATDEKEANKKAAHWPTRRSNRRMGEPTSENGKKRKKDHYHKGELVTTVRTQSGNKMKS